MLSKLPKGQSCLLRTNRKDSAPPVETPVPGWKEQLLPAPRPWVAVGIGEVVGPVTEHTHSSPHRRFRKQPENRLSSWRLKKEPVTCASKISSNYLGVLHHQQTGGGWAAAVVPRAPRCVFLVCFDGGVWRVCEWNRLLIGWGSYKVLLFIPTVSLQEKAGKGGKVSQPIGGDWLQRTNGTSTQAWFGV